MATSSSASKVSCGSAPRRTTSGPPTPTGTTSTRWRLRASDGRYTSVLSEVQVIAVNNVNEAPVFTTKSRAEFSQRENTASVLYTYRASDADREDVIASSVEGFDGDDFAIHNGVLTFRRCCPTTKFRRTRGATTSTRSRWWHRTARGSGTRVDATVTVTEMNEGPKVTGKTAFTVVEGHDLVGASFTANDQEGDEVTSWSLAGSDGGDFTISESGVMTFQTLPDYDRPADSNRDNQYLVRVRAYDSGNRYGFLDVVVTVTGVNEGVPVVTGNRSLSFPREHRHHHPPIYIPGHGLGPEHCLHLVGGGGGRERLQHHPG